ncbi:MAG TPA: hypothetical protein VK537_07600 [Galbitalea sp.]|nr:hypothetical protein [Galbitalea sp.]
MDDIESGWPEVAHVLDETHVWTRDALGPFWELTVEDPFDPSAWFELGVPAGFPLWYRPEPAALPVGPIGRLIQRTQCRCGHDELQHIILLDECLAGCDCPRYVPRTLPVRMGWHERLVRAIRDAWGWM